MGGWSSRPNGGYGGVLVGVLVCEDGGYGGWPDAEKQPRWSLLEDGGDTDDDHACQWHLLYQWMSDLPIHLQVVDRFVRRTLRRKATRPDRLVSNWVDLRYPGLHLLGLCGDSPWDGGMQCFLFRFWDDWDDMSRLLVYTVRLPHGNRLYPYELADPAFPRTLLAQFCAAHGEAPRRPLFRSPLRLATLDPACVGYHCHALGPDRPPLAPCSAVALGTPLTARAPPNGRRKQQQQPSRKARTAALL